MAKFIHPRHDPYRYEFKSDTQKETVIRNLVRAESHMDDVLKLIDKTLGKIPEGEDASDLAIAKQDIEYTIDTIAFIRDRIAVGESSETEDDDTSEE